MPSKPPALTELTSLYNPLGKPTDAPYILNALWQNGIPMETLQKAIDPNGTNTAAQIIQKLRQLGVQDDAIRNAATHNKIDYQGNPFTTNEQGRPITTHTDPAPDFRVIEKNEIPPPPASKTTVQSGRGNINVQQAQGPAAAPKPKPKSQAELEAEFRRKYGSYGWMLDDPGFQEVRKKLLEAVEGGWGEQEIMASIQNTEWFKHHDAQGRKWDVIKKSDTGEATRLLARAKERISAAASQMGVELDAGTIDAMADQWNAAGLENGWDDFKLKNAIASQAQYKPDYGGDIGAFETEVKGYARGYLQNITDEAAFNYAKQIAGGTIDKDNVIASFRKTAKGILPDYAKEIDDGLTPRDLLATHFNTIGNLLEINPDSIDIVNDPRFNPILGFTDDKGKRRTMTVSETMKQVKGLDDYWKTNNAQGEVGKLLTGLGQTFGKLA